MEGFFLDAAHNERRDAGLDGLIKRRKRGAPRDLIKSSSRKVRRDKRYKNHRSGGGAGRKARSGRLPRDNLVNLWRQNKEIEKVSRERRLTTAAMLARKATFWCAAQRSGRRRAGFWRTPGPISPARGLRAVFSQ
ncbi:hypothetical protein [Rhodoblastus sp.]|uniref:hypothetical protein n=1 Tax=Rhodoblastus sp. TaxID=1962975 RepID=UPI0035B32597